MQSQLEQVDFPRAGFAPVIARVAPAVVNVGVRSFRAEGQGSGVIVSDDGTVITNAHVVDGADRVRVVLPNGGRKFTARLVGTDPRTDIAVLKIDATGLPFAALGDSTRVQVGEFALAIGNPFGLGQTVTLGIVSAVGRKRVGIVDYEEFIQTDAAINPGNSGGALVDQEGKLIGINTAIIARGGRGNQGVGFAVPVHLARTIMEQLQRTGRVVRGWLGLAIQELGPGFAEAFGVDDEGVLVCDVVNGGPAERAGIDSGDVVVAIDGEPARESHALRMRIARAAPGSKARLTVVRGKQRRDVEVTFAELPNEDRRRRRGPTAGPIAPEQLGISVGPSPTGKGVMIVAVQPGSRADDAGLVPGDVVREANRRPVGSVAELAAVLKEARADAVLFHVVRGGGAHYVLLERS